MKIKLLFLFSWCFLAFNINAQIPSNNEIQNAINVTTLPFLDANVQTQIANDDIGGSIGGCDLGTYSKVYYKYTPTSDVTLSINLPYGYSESIIIPTTSSVDNPTDVTQLTIVNTVSCSFRKSLSVDLVSGNSYFFLVSNSSRATDVQFYIEDNTDIITFPDQNFKDALVSHTNPVIDINGDSEIQVNEAFIATKIKTSYKDITDISGLEYFSNLVELEISGDDILSIDLSNMVYLKELSLNDTELTSIDLSNNTLLEKLNINNGSLHNNGSLTVLDVSNNTLLKELSLFDNDLTNLDLSNNTQLEELSCGKNNLTDLDLSNNNKLKNLSFNLNKLTSIDLTNNIQLVEVGGGQNELTSITFGNNNNLEELNLLFNQISSIDLANLTSLKKLSLQKNNFTDLDVSNNTDLREINIINNNFSNEVDLSNNLQLRKIRIPFNYNLSNHLLLEELYIKLNNEIIDLSNNLDLISLSIVGLSEIDLTTNVGLRKLDIRDSSISEIDLSNNPLILNLIIANNNFLNKLNFKNGGNTIYDSSFVSYTSNSGTNENIVRRFIVRNNPNLSFVCVDDVAYANTNFTNKDSHSTFVDNCDNVSESNTIIGSVIFDEDNNGCDASDLKLDNFFVNSTNGVTNYGNFTNVDGEYILNLHEGDYTTELLNVPSYFTIQPVSVSTTFTGFNNQETEDFCLVANQTINDVNITILPLDEARPGFNSSYQLVYENVGTTTQNGEVTFEYDNALQAFVSSDVTVNSSTSSSITFNYSNLKPFESRVINIELNTLTPPTVNDGDVLDITATINPVSGDFTMNDNTFILNQIAVNSFDPNDKRVLQGSSILESETSEYLDYIIRFQNTGSADAINVVITDQLNSKLDWRTLKMVSSSHNYNVEIINNGFVTFTFNDINLVPQQVNEENSNGFVAFKIKPKEDVALGDIIYGQSKIYFDFNLPIITNNVSTEVVEILSVNDYELNQKVTLFPNPVEDFLYIKNYTNLDIKEIEIYNISGQKILSKQMSDDKLDVKNLATGIYYVKVLNRKGKVYYTKIIKN